MWMALQSENAFTETKLKNDDYDVSSAGCRCDIDHSCCGQVWYGGVFERVPQRQPCSLLVTPFPERWKGTSEVPFNSPRP